MARLTFFCSSISREMNDWDVSRVTDFEELFREKFNFNEDISNWDVSGGTSFVSVCGLDMKSIVHCSAHEPAGGRTALTPLKILTITSLFTYPHFSA